MPKSLAQKRTEHQQYVANMEAVVAKYKAMMEAAVAELKKQSAGAKEVHEQLKEARQAARAMEQERDAIDRELRIVERIDSTALAYSTRELYRDSLITIRSLADSAAMRVEVPLDELSGRIGIDYYYTLDSLDRNDNLQNRHALLSATGKSRGSAVQRLRKGPRTAYSTSLPCSREAVKLEITFGNYPERPKRMHLTIDSLVVTYVPPLSEAYEELSHTYRYRLMIDDREYNTFYYDEENSRPLRFPSPLLPPECDSLMER